MHATTPDPSVLIPSRGWVGLGATMLLVLLLIMPANTAPIRDVSNRDAPLPGPSVITDTGMFIGVFVEGSWHAYFFEQDDDGVDDFDSHLPEQFGNLELIEPAGASDLSEDDLRPMGTAVPTVPTADPGQPGSNTEDLYRQWAWKFYAAAFAYDAEKIPWPVCSDGSGGGRGSGDSAARDWTLGLFWVVDDGCDHDFVEDTKQTNAAEADAWTNDVLQTYDSDHDGVDTADAAEADAYQTEFTDTYGDYWFGDDVHGHAVAEVSGNIGAVPDAETWAWDTDECVGDECYTEYHSIDSVAAGSSDATDSLDRSETTHLTGNEYSGGAGSGGPGLLTQAARARDDDFPWTGCGDAGVSCTNAQSTPTTRRISGTLRWTAIQIVSLTKRLVSNRVAGFNLYG